MFDNTVNSPVAINCHYSIIASRRQYSEVHLLSIGDRVRIFRVGQQLPPIHVHNLNMDIPLYCIRNLHGYFSLRRIGINFDIESVILVFGCYE